MKKLIFLPFLFITTIASSQIVLKMGLTTPLISNTTLGVDAQLGTTLHKNFCYKQELLVGYFRNVAQQKNFYSLKYGLVLPNEISINAGAALVNEFINIKSNQTLYVKAYGTYILSFEKYFKTDVFDRHRVYVGATATDNEIYARVGIKFFYKLK